MADQHLKLAAAETGERGELDSELEARDQEILRLRDVLMTRDQEIGALKGRLAMIDQASRSLGDAVARIPIPGATRVLQALIRFVQRATG